MTDKEQQREYRTVSYLCSTLANICSAPPNMVIDALTGLLWDEEEAGQIKVANTPDQQANDEWPHHEKNQQNHRRHIPYSMEEK